MLNMNMKTVQRKMKKGQIPAIKRGGEWRATKGEITRWMNEQRYEKNPQKRDIDYVY